MKEKKMNNDEKLVDEENEKSDKEKIKTKSDLEKENVQLKSKVQFLNNKLKGNQTENVTTTSDIKARKGSKE